MSCVRSFQFCGFALVSDQAEHCEAAFVDQKDKVIHFKIMQVNISFLSSPHYFGIHQNIEQGLSLKGLHSAPSSAAQPPRDSVSPDELQPSVCPLDADDQILKPMLVARTAYVQQSLALPLLPNNVTSTLSFALSPGFAGLHGSLLLLSSRSLLADAAVSHLSLQSEQSLFSNFSREWHTVAWLAKAQQQSLGKRRRYPSVIVL